MGHPRHIDPASRRVQHLIDAVYDKFNRYIPRYAEHENEIRLSNQNLYPTLEAIKVSRGMNQTNVISSRIVATVKSITVRI